MVGFTGIPLSALLALGSAVLWGVGDFAGGVGVKHAGGSMRAALRFVLLSHGLGFCALVVIALARHDAFPQGAPLAWGFAAGIASCLAVAGFYVALSRGAMGAAAAVSGLLAAAIPALVSAFVEGSPTPRRLAGFCTAGLAIWLIGAGEPSAEKSVTSGNLIAAVSGAGFGVYFIALRFAGASGLFWPMAIARFGSIALCSILLLVTALPHRTAKARHPPTFSRTSILAAIAAAVLDTSGNLLFLAATRVGRLDVAAVLGSLYPATTILLAAYTLKESPTRRQGLGMGVAVAAVMLIAL